MHGYILSRYFYRPQRSCGQGNVFTGVCLSQGGGGCLPQCMLGCHTPRPGRHPLGPGRHPRRDQADPPGPGTPPDQADPQDQADPPPRDQIDTPLPPRTRETPRDQVPPPGPGRPPPGSRLQYTIYERPVRILLECILVSTK